MLIRLNPRTELTLEENCETFPSENEMGFLAVPILLSLEI